MIFRRAVKILGCESEGSTKDMKKSGKWCHEATKLI